MKRLLILLSTLLWLSGCWNKDYNEPGRISVNKRSTKMAIKAGFQPTWKALQKVIAKFPIKEKKVNSSIGQAYVVTDWVRAKSDTLYHGFDVNRVPYEIRYQFYIYVTADPKKNRTIIKIKSVEQYLDDVVTAGVDFQGSVKTWIRTNSSTLKEHALLKQVNKLITKPRKKRKK